MSIQPHHHHRSSSPLSTPGHSAGRSSLRMLGFILVGIGGIFALVGLVDFFSAFGTFHPPTKFWCAFVGLPMVAAGVRLLKMGYLGAVSRYVAEETVPVVRDSAVELAEGLRPTIRGIASDLRESDRPAPASVDPSVRLVRLEKLRSDGLINDGEYAEQRSRILREL